MNTEPPRSHVGPMCLVAMVCAACLLPFAGKAFHIDDPLFLWSAQQIHRHPADFYGFNVNWQSYSKPMWDETRNPPLACYYLAAAAWLFGWGEAGLHVAFIVPAMAVAVGTYRLALGLCTRPAGAALAAVLTPAFLVSSTNVMCDTLMLAFWVWACVLWLEGLELQKNARLATAGLLIGFGALTKYFAMSLLPLLALYALVQRRRLGWWILALLIPVALLTAYQAVTAHLYGFNLAREAASFATQSQVRSRSNITEFGKLVESLSFTGGCMAVIYGYAPLLWSRRTLLLAVIVSAGFAWMFVTLGSIGPFIVVLKDGTVRWGVVAQAVGFAAGGVGVLALAYEDLRQSRDANSVLLALWVGGTFVFTAFFNWTINARSILPMVPAAAILLMRALERRDLKPFRHPLLPLLPGACLALAACLADYQLANSARVAAALVPDRVAELGGKKLWFEGHWGFQYYMQDHGGAPLDMQRVRLSAGDIVVVPLNNCGLFQLPAGSVRQLPSMFIPGPTGMATLHFLTGAGFYANRIGPLPLSFGPVPAEEYQLLRVEQPLDVRLEYSTTATR